MYFDFLGNPTSGQLLSPTGRPPDPSSGGVCMDEAVNYGIDSGQRNRLSTDQMDMDVNLGCDKYGHSKESCGSSGDGVSIEKLIRHPEPLVDDKFGPWRQVSSRKCRPTVMRRGLHAENSSVAPRSGSRFDVLAHVVEGSSDEAAAISLGVLPVDVSAGVDLREQGRVPKGSDQHSLVVVTETKTAAGVLPQVTFTEPIPSPHVVAKGQVINVPSQLQLDKYVAVWVIEYWLYSDVSGHNDRPLYGPIQSTYAKGVKRHSVSS
ncbi:hypothetical protein V6N12_059468 [Hibiscus sabdariffa]|uniref:Uncharacterized protein n=1 Tax=Hibiscus sabdariffa TaxID=183260 RepID=A0ABR2EX59_9ROSI